MKFDVTTAGQQVEHVADNISAEKRLVNVKHTFDKQEAMKRLKQMSLANHARQFPQYWTTYWSSADNIESSLVASDKGAPGLPDQTSVYPDIAIACAHIHAWMLYCYHKLNTSL